jgi:hypothetical protein
MIIDIHAHTTEKMLWGLHTQQAGINDIESQMQEYGVDLVVLLATYFPFKRTGLPNQKLLEKIIGIPYFRMFGSLDAMNNLNEGLKELRFLAEQHTLVGIKLYPGYQDFNPTEILPVYELASEFNLPVMFHTGELHHCCPKEERLHQKFRCGYDHCRLETLTELANPSNLGKVAQLFPEVSFIFSHLGNPYFEELREVMRRNPNVFTDISGQFLSGSSEDTPEYRELLRTELLEFLALPSGENRILFGTDFPIQSYADSIALVESLELDSETEQRIFWKNAASLLKESL